MPSTPCPKCNQVNLVRLKMLKAGDPAYGKEYEACSRCNAYWFLDDPNRPLPPPDAKPKLSFWEKLGSWGAPDKIPDSFGQIHPATYVLPPVHDYPPVLFPLLDEPRPTFAVPPPPPPPVPPPHMPSRPPSPVPPPASASDSNPPPPPPPPPMIEMPTPEPFQPESQPAASPEPEPAPPEPQPEPEPEPEPQLEQDPMPQQDAYDQEEEQARYDRLMRIAHSPSGPLPEEQGWGEYDQPYDPQPQEQHSSAGTEHPQRDEHLSPDEQQLRDTLRRVVATPRPPSPLGYAGSSAGGRTPHVDQGMGPPADEAEIAAYARHISERLDEAIQKSPFISKDVLRTPRSAFSEAPRQTRSHTPAAARSSFNTPRHSVPGTPRPPPGQDEQDGVPLPGGFPTPKSAPLTTAAIDQLESQSTHLSATIRTFSRSGSLPCPPSHHAPSQLGSNYGSRAGSRAGKRVSIAHTGGSQSPLFS